ncbi:MAG: 50S ribosomal protein L15 [Planctomycetes bacterium]|nr:50S ribosomal protein L15 [Planctomycetota bacterium]
MMIHEITIKVGKYKVRRRVGRGHGSGRGKTSGRGHKGAASRSGWKRRAGYEGGQMPIIRRMPKRGFTNAPFRRLYHVVNVKTLQARCVEGAEVTAATLADAGVIRDAKLPLKILGEGELTKKLTVTAAKFSASAKAKIEAVGGAVTAVPRIKWTRPRRTNERKVSSAGPTGAR